MPVKLNANSQIVLDKKFKAIPRGYDPFEVDEFLDVILKDYRTIETNCLMKEEEIKELKNKIMTLEKEKKQLEISNASYAKRFQNIKETDNVTIDNIDYISRIRALENYLWKIGHNPTKIK